MLIKQAYFNIKRRSDLLRKTSLASLTLLPFLAVATLCLPTPGQAVAAPQDAPLIRLAAEKKAVGRR